MVKRPPPVPVGIKILTGPDVSSVLSSVDPSAALKSQRSVFLAYSASHAASAATTANAAPPTPAAIQTPARIVLSTPDNNMLFMPSRADGAGGTAIKIVSVPTAGGDGLPATTLVMDEKSGRVRGVVNARKLTALRNACGSALSYRALYPSGAPSNLLLFGTGAQTDAHARIFLKLYPSITSCTFIARRSTPRSASLLISLTHAFPAVSFHIGISPSISASGAEAEAETPSESNLAIDLPAAVHAADIIITATSSTEALFSGADLCAGTHMVLIGSYKPHMREVDGEAVRRAGRVVVDSSEACAREAGELIGAGLGEGDVLELGEILREGNEALAGEVRQSGDVTMFKSVGIGIQDVAIAALVLDEADRIGLGTIVPDYD